MNARGTIDWHFFLRGLAEEVDTLARPEERDDLLRGIGRRMARMMPLAPTQSLESLQIEINDALTMVGWGNARFTVLEQERQLQITHRDMPRIGSLGLTPGQWLSALLEGMYEAWLAQQPGHQPVLAARRQAGQEQDAVVLHYGRQG